MLRQVEFVIEITLLIVQIVYNCILRIQKALKHIDNSQDLFPISDSSSYLSLLSDISILRKSHQR